MDLSDIDIILFEGLYALCSKAPLQFFDYCAAGVFMETEEVNIRRWKWEREQNRIHARSPEQFALHIDTFIKEYHRHIACSRQNAFCIINVDSNHNYTLDFQTPAL